MPSIKNLEMAAAVSSYEHISISKSFFGLSQKMVYTPTNSPVRIIINEYAPTEGERLEHLLSLPINEIEAELKAKGKPASTAIGHYRLECCLSEDLQFCALRYFVLLISRTFQLSSLVSLRATMLRLLQFSYKRFVYFI